MRKFLVFMWLPMLLLCMTACESSEIDKKINMATTAIEDDDYEKAQKICDQLMKNNWSELTLENKCDLTICYTALYSELSDNEENNMASLKKCYNSAMKENPKETRKYFKSLDEEAGEAVHEVIKFIIEMDELGDELEDLDF